jgi:hypothetical protein
LPAPLLIPSFDHNDRHIDDGEADDGKADDGKAATMGKRPMADAREALAGWPRDACAMASPAV